MSSTPSRIAVREPAAQLPVARVAVDSPLPHLDRLFDYLIPNDLDDVVQPGSRVRVRFAGRLIDAWVLERAEASEHDGRLAWLERGVGDEPVLTPSTTRLFRAVADRWAGTFADVVRLGVPPRHARAEAIAQMEAATAPDAPGDEGWRRYRAGHAFLGAVGEGRPARAVWNALPGEDWPARVSEIVQAALASGKGAIVVVPDHRDLARVDAALTAALPSGSHVVLSADLGPQARYKRWLAVRRGTVKAVVGARSAIFAPVANLGVVVVWDDGDDLHGEPRAPYPHARDVAVLRSSMDECALLVGGFAQTAESAMLLESGWARPIAADRDAVRAVAPRVSAVGDDFEAERDPAARSARLPGLALRTARDALAAGKPVLVQVPRRGYVPALACIADRTPARCSHCHGPLAATSGHAIATCRWCGRAAGDWQCPTCGGRRMRAVVIGSARTAEEIGRAFPGAVVRTSAGDSVLADIPAGPSVVIATPGAEPIAPDGYGAGLLLDAWALLSRPDLRAGEEAVRRWLNAAALMSPGAPVVIGGDAGLATVQAVIRWDPAGFAERELSERRELGFAPVARLAAITGAAADVSDLLANARLPATTEELGAAPAPSTRQGGEAQADLTRVLLRVPRPEGVHLAEALHAAAAVRSARKSGGPVKVVLDPLEVV